MRAFCSAGWIAFDTYLPAVKIGGGADISYVWTREGWLYLAVVIDLFARRVVGWATATGCIANWLSTHCARP